ncbi:hypothetical protein [Brucella intermedia]|uniref:hypothetical protein n=1 Tax=Brucella intermedia TaxID=94625 RepID=UPI00244B5596|nr:hypothetical protein [Brucella intermedia]WGG61896.1 hypothetical protein QA414_15365 [Brucella intermedia]
MPSKEQIRETFDRDEIVLAGLASTAEQYVSDQAVNAAINASDAYSRKHMLKLVQTGNGDPGTLQRERMRYAIAAGMIVCAASALGGQSE